MEIEKINSNDSYTHEKHLVGQKIVEKRNGKQENSDSANDDNLNLMTKQLNLNSKCSTLKDLINGLYKIFESDEVNIEEVHSLMSAYKSNPAEWLKYAKFDKFRYTRNLVDAGNGKFNLMVLCWGEGHGSSIHDHADAHCFMKILAGDLCEVRFEWPKTNPNKNDQCVSSMKEISRTVLPTNGVCYINDSLGLHRVENLSYSDCAVSLHLYCPPFQACKVFNERTGLSIKAPVTFWSMYGKRNKNEKNQNIVPEDN